MFKFMGAAVLVALTAFGQNTVLSQLGARGSTTVGGTAAFSKYIVLLDDAGKINPAMLHGTAGGGIALSRMAFVDPVAGTDTASSGTIAQPYQTLGYAVTRPATSNLLDCTFVLLPGVHSNVTLDVTKAPGLQRLTLLGLGGPAIGSITYTASATTTVRQITLDGVAVGTLTHPHNKPLALYLTGKASIGTLDGINSTDSVVTVYRDPDTPVTFGSNTRYLVVPTHTGDTIGAAYGGITTNVTGALALIRTAVLTNAGDIAVLRTDLITAINATQELSQLLTALQASTSASNAAVVARLDGVTNRLYRLESGYTATTQQLATLTFGLTNLTSVVTNLPAYKIGTNDIARWNSGGSGAAAGLTARYVYLGSSNVLDQIWRVGVDPDGVSGTLNFDVFTENGWVTRGWFE